MKKVFQKTKIQNSRFSEVIQKKNKNLITIVGVSTVGLGLLCNYFYASEGAAHPTDLPFSHKGMDQAFDSKSIRRGYFVYKNVCSTCHGMKKLAMRNLVGVAFTQSEAKKLAEDIMIIDAEPDEKGDPVERTGTLADYFPSPYRNDKEARFANGGALPPDLSLIVKARDYGEDYIFSLLTGYCEPPAGFELRKGLHYNAYFPGGAIGMAPPLNNDNQIEFEDGTEPTVSQMAKDVSTFLAYSSIKEQDERKKMGLKVLLGLTALMAIAYYHKRFRWSLLKSRRVYFEE